MRTEISSAVLLIALSAAAVAQTETRAGIPPTREEIPTLAPPQAVAQWPAQQRDGAFLEASVAVSPVTGLLAKGVRPPSESSGAAGATRSTPRPLPPGPDPLFQPGGGNPPDLFEDQAYPNPTQPVMQGFEGMGPNGEDPPCPSIGVGYDHIVTATSDDFAVYDRAGNLLFQSDIHDFTGIDPSFEMISPHVVFDPWNGRWVMLYHMLRESTQEAFLVLLVSEDHNPFGIGNHWYYPLYAGQAGPSGETFPNSYYLGFSEQYVTLGGNQYYYSSGSFLWSRIWVLDKTEIYNAATATLLKFSDLYNPDGTQTFSPRPVEMQCSWSEGGKNMDATWINSRGGGGDKLTHWKLQDAFGPNSLTKVDIDVPGYAYPPTGIQPNGSLLHLVDCRLQKAVTTADFLGSNGIELFTSLNAERSGTTGINLYKIDPQASVREWSSTYGATDWYYGFASVAADFTGSAVWTFARTANLAGAEPEMRFVDYDQGAITSSTSIRDGEGCYDHLYWGYYFCAQLDWGDYVHNGGVTGNPSKVWLYGQYGLPDSWSTYVAATSVWNQGDLSSVKPTTTYAATGPVGGPFDLPQREYTLFNTGDVGLAYEVSGLPSWLDATPSSGDLYPGSTKVTLSVNSTANWLTPGVYAGSVKFRDVFNGGQSYVRQVQLTVTGNGTAYCTGEAGSGTPCPCSNDHDGSLPDAGCRNGAYPSGAKLIATGSASVKTDTLVLAATHLDPNNSGLYFQANNAVNGGAGTVFGDGLRCAGGGLIRLQVRFANSSGSSQTTISISKKGAVSAGETKYYQCWYRDTSGKQPCGAGVNDFNLTNGCQVVWKP